MLQAIADRTRTVQPDEPQGRPVLKVVPILGPSLDQPTYRLLDKQTLERVRIEEISDAGSVPELRVVNELDERLFLMDGQELVGAKQNRILNTDVLVPANTQLKIPVSCVEAGRWRYDSPRFSVGKNASHRTRSGKSSRVHQALKMTGTFDADQGAVWDEVRYCLEDVGAASATHALSDAYAMRQKDLDAFRGELRMPAGAVGLAVYRGGRFLGLDLFDRHTTLVYFWESLVDSYAIDWLLLEAAPAEGEATPQPVADVLRQAADAEWEGFQAPGEGRDYRLSNSRFTGSALVWEESTVVHLQVSPVADDAGRAVAEKQVARRPRIHRRYGRDSEPRVY